MKHIVFVAPNSFVVRNWLSSGLASLCQEQLDLSPVFVTPFYDEAFQCHDGSTFKNCYIPMVDDLTPVGYSPTLARLHMLRLIAFALDVENGSRQMMIMAKLKGKTVVAVKIAKALFPRGTQRRVLVRWLLDSYGPRHEPAADILRQLDCQFVITGSPGFFALDQVFMIESKRLRIPTHCVVSSWDNMTSRGPMIGRPQTLMVWNEYMRDDAVRIHQYPSDRIYVVGSLQFTPYGAPVTPEETDYLYARLGLPRGIPYLLYCTGQHFPQYEAGDVQVLASLLPATEYADIPLVVRLHPQADSKPFEAVTDPKVILDYAPRFAWGGGSGSRFDLSEIRYMAALLSNAKIIIASWGTTVLLEAAIWGKPALQLRWMDSVPRKHPDQAVWIRRMQEYIHLIAFDATGSRHFCDSPALFACSVDYLVTHEEEFRQRRKMAVDSLVGTPLNESPQRIVNVLKFWLSDSRSASYPV